MKENHMERVLLVFQKLIMFDIINHNYRVGNKNFQNQKD